MISAPVFGHKTYLEEEAMLRKWGSMHAVRNRAAFYVALAAPLLIASAGMARADETFALSSVVGIPGGFTSADGS